MKQLLFFLSIIPIFIVGCGESSSSNPPLDSVNLTVKIGYNNSIISRDIKRVKLNDIKTIKLSIFDSKRDYLKEESFNKLNSNSWELEVFSLPINTDLTFIAEAFNSDGYKILHGDITKKISQNSSSVTIPIALSQGELVISLPTIENAKTGDTNDGNLTVKSITFSIINPNSNKVDWKLSPDKALENYGYFDKTSGTLDFRYKNQIDLTIYFNIVNQFIENQDSTKLFFKDLSFDNRIDINTTIGDSTTTFFKIYEQQNSLKISIAPIVDNIYLLRQNEDITVNAIVDSKLLKTEICSNNFDKLFNNFKFSERKFEDLFNHFYNSTDIEIDTEHILETLKSEINSSIDSNLSKLLIYDINQTFESIFKSEQIKYGLLDEDFQKIYKYLTDEGFIKILEYYKSSEKDFMVIFKSFYKDDEVFLKIISDYENTFGVNGFSDLIKYMINSSESTLLTDYNLKDRNFSQNGDYYYLKFKAENNVSKDNLHTLIEKIDSLKLEKYIETFNAKGLELHMLMRFYFQKDNVYNAKFIHLLTFIIDENFDSILQNLKNIYSGKNSTFDKFVELVENREFQQYLEYYKFNKSELYNFIRAKYDYDICTTTDFGQIYFDWILESNPYNYNSQAYIKDRYKNPIKILNSGGNLEDKVILKVENSEGIITEYSYIVSMKDWKDGGKPLDIVQDETSKQTPNNSSTNGDNNNSTSGDNNSSTENINITDWQFNLATSSSTLSMLYGETKTISFSTSKTFPNITYDVLGFQNNLIFNSSKIVKISDNRFELNITAKNIEGSGSFSFVAQNEFFSTSSKINIEIKKPINIYNLYNSYTLFTGQTYDINFNFKTPRGNNLMIDITNSSNSNFDIYPSHLKLQNVYDKNHTIKVVGKNKGVSSILMTVTDNTTVPTYIVEIPIQINVVESDETEIQQALKDREKNIFICRSSLLSKSSFEYISDTYDENYVKATGDDSPNRIDPMPRELISVLSENSSYPTNPLFSTILVLYPVGIQSDGILDETFNVYNHNNNSYIGEVKYSTEARGREFYVKYYDNVTDSVICEKHKF